MTKPGENNTKYDLTDEVYCNYVCAKFDAAISGLEEAKKLYLQGRYLDSYASVDKSSGTTSMLGCAIDNTIYRQKISRHGDLKSLTTAEKQKISALNDRLKWLEKKIEKEVNVLTGLFDERINFLEETFLSEYDIDVRVEFYLNETDPDARDNSDNLLAKVSDFTIDMLDADENWNDMPAEIDHNECYLLHSLKWHHRPRLTWHDLLRIGRIWTDITVLCQNVLEPLEGHTDSANAPK